MPRGDGMGPPPGAGRKGGRGGGQGRGGRMNGNRTAAGPGGECICPKCGTKTPHQAGVPCFQVNCPSCGSQMVRK